MDWTQALLIAGLALASIVATGSIAVFILIRLPVDYFVNPRRALISRDRRPLSRILLIVAKNLVGVVLVAAGILLSLPGVPGQGVITVLIGILLLDFPGKFRLERWLVGRRWIGGAINGLRRRFRKAPLHLPE